MSYTDGGDVSNRDAATDDVGRIVPLGTDSKVVKVGVLGSLWWIHDPPVPALARLVIASVGAEDEMGFDEPDQCHPAGDEVSLSGGADDPGGGELRGIVVPFGVRFVKGGKVARKLKAGGPCAGLMLLLRHKKLRTDAVGWGWLDGPETSDQSNRGDDTLHKVVIFRPNKQINRWIILCWKRWGWN